MAPPAGQTIGRWRLDHAPASAATARRLVRAILDDPGEPAGAVSEQTCQRAVLAASELVANAVRHGSPPLDLEIRRVQPGWVLAVFDGDVHEPVHRAVEQMAESGRGLLIVDRAGERHGWEPSADGKVVWVEIRERDGDR